MSCLGIVKKVGRRRASSNQTNLAENKNKNSNRTNCGSRDDFTSLYLRVCNDIFCSQAMVAILRGPPGPSVLCLVEMGVVAVHGLAPIPH